MKIFQSSLILESIGLTVNPLNKSEIKAHVALAGPLLQLKLLAIEYALPAVKSFKQGFQHKICLVAVDLRVAEDATEVIHIQLGLTTKIQVSLRAGCMRLKIGVNLTLLHLAIIIQLENINHVEHRSRLQSAKKSV